MSQLYHLPFFYPLSTHLFGNEFNIHISCLIIRMIHNFILIVHIRIDPLDNHFSERASHLGNRLFSGLCIHNQFCEHGIIIRRHFIAIIDSCINPNSFSARKYTSVISPAMERNCSFGFSALILHSIACPPILTSCWR